MILIQYGWHFHIKNNLLYPRKILRCNYSSIPYLQKRFDWTAVEDMEWMSNYIPYKTLSVITYSCPNLTTYVSSSLGSIWVFWVIWRKTTLIFSRYCVGVRMAPTSLSGFIISCLDKYKLHRRIFHNQYSACCSSQSKRMLWPRVKAPRLAYVSFTRHSYIDLYFDMNMPYGIVASSADTIIASFQLL